MDNKLSNTKLKFRIKRKTNPAVVEAIMLAKKNKAWNKLAKILSGSARKYSSVNLSDIDKESKAGDTIIVPGKVLALGELTKKVKICSLSLSNSAKEKLKASKSEFSSIADEIKRNTKAEGVKILQ